MPEAKGNARSQTVCEAGTNPISQSESPEINPCPEPQRTSDSKPMPEARAICPDPQSISEAKQTSPFPETIRIRKEVSREYGERHHFQHVQQPVGNYDILVLYIYRVNNNILHPSSLPSIFLPRFSPSYLGRYKPG